MTTGANEGAPRFGLGLTVAMALLVLWTILWGGLYLDTSQHAALGLATLVLAGVLVLGLVERRRFVSSPVRLAALAQWLAYVVALWVAVTPRLALQEVVRYGLFAVALLVASELARSAGVRGTSRPAPVALVWAAVSLFSLGSLGAAAVGLTDVVSEGRLYSLMGYPNAAGALAGAGFLLGLGLGSPRARAAAPGAGRTAKESLAEWFLAAGQWGNLMVLLLSLSRGTWLVVPLAGLAVLIAWPRGHRLTMIGEVACAGLSVLPLAAIFPRVYGQPLAGLGLLAAGILLAFGLRWLAGRVAEAPARWRGLVVGAALAVNVVVIAAGLGLGLAPETMVQRLTTAASFSERSAVERVLWSRDAWSVIRDYPLLGVGGGGWASVHPQYQSYGYFTREVHNDFLEIWVETGTIGFGAWLALLAAAGWSLYRLSRRQPRPLTAGLGGAVALLVLHCGVDFNLALGAMGVVLWVLLGLIDGLDLAESRAEPRPGPAAGSRAGSGRAAKAGRRGTKSRPRAAGSPSPALWPGALVLLPALALSLVSLSLLAGARHGAQATRFLAGGDNGSAHRTFARAVSFDPWSASLRMNQALACERLAAETNEARYLDESVAAAERALALDPLSPNTHAFSATLAWRRGAVDLALTEAETALKLQPFEPKRYADLAAMRVLAGQDQLRQGDADGARQEFEKAALLIDASLAQAAKVSALAPPDALFEALTPDLALYAGQALLGLGRSPEALPLLETAYVSKAVAFGEDAVRIADRRVTAALWLSAWALRTGQAAAAADYLGFALRSTPDAEAVRAEILELLAAG